MTLREFLKKYIYPTTTISVFVRKHEDTLFWDETVIYECVANDVLEGKVGSELLDREVTHICSGREYSLIIDIKGE